MLEGLEATEILLQDLLHENERFRFDSEFLLKRYAIYQQQIENHPFEKLRTLTRDIIHPGEIKREYVEAEEGVWFFRTQNVRPLRIDDGAKVLISPEDAAKLSKGNIQKGDLLLTRTGANFGQCAVYQQDEKAIASSHVFIIRTAGIRQRYLSVFRNTLHGRELINKGQYGAAQPEAAPYYLLNIPIPTFSDEFQEATEKLVADSQDCIADSKALYRQAEADLLRHLGLPAQPPRPVLHEVVTNVKTLNQSAVSSGRWDAEFYETRHDSLADQLTAQPWITLGSACREPINRGVQPEFVEGGEVFVVASKAVRPHGLDLRPDETTSAAFFSSAKATKGRIQQYDVLLNGTGRGTLGRAGIHTSPTPALADNHVTLLRLRPGGLNPFYLMLFLNSWPGQLQSEQWQCGSSGQTELYPNQMEQFIIPNLPPAQQAAIAAQVQRSFTLRTESEALLTRAKQAVEVAIEQGETAGLALLLES